MTYRPSPDHLDEDHSDEKHFGGGSGEPFLNFTEMKPGGTRSSNFKQSGFDLGWLASFFPPPSGVLLHSPQR